MICEMFSSDKAKQFYHTNALLKLAKDHYEEKENNGRKSWTVYTFLVWYHKFFVELFLKITPPETLRISVELFNI